MLRDKPVPLGHEVVEGRETLTVEEPPILKQRHLQPALVLEVQGLKELGGIGGVPSAFLVERPNPFMISPMPTAPAATSSSSWRAIRSPEPGPTSLRSSEAKNTKRSA